MEEVTLEENTEEDSCLDMLATQNAEQFTPQMLAITKAQVHISIFATFLNISFHRTSSRLQKTML
jgi:hypothetical protein